MAFQITTLSGSISGSTVPGASTYVDGGVPMFSGSTQVQASEATDGMIFLDPTGSLFVYEQPSVLDPATYFTQDSGLAPFFSFDSTTKIHTATWGLLSSDSGITNARNIENSSALWFKLPNFDYHFLENYYRKNRLYILIINTCICWLFIKFLSFLEKIKVIFITQFLKIWTQFEIIFNIYRYYFCNLSIFFF